MADLENFLLHKEPYMENHETLIILCGPSMVFIDLNGCKTHLKILNNHQILIKNQMEKKDQEALAKQNHPSRSGGNGVTLWGHHHN